MGLVNILPANALHLPLTKESVDCCVTSPPYWNLRDYKIDGQLGLEETPEDYVENMVKAFKEVWRVLKPKGTLWLNLGDSYFAQGGRGEARMVELGRPSPRAKTNPSARGQSSGTRKCNGLPLKNLVGIPWRVAFALQADGWILRSDIIWSKINPMPESVQDRPTKAHEYLFMFVKQPKYYWDQVAVREESVKPGRVRMDSVGGASHAERQQHSKGGLFRGAATRNIRTVWSIATQPFPGAHFAVMPPKLVEPCILAGTSEKGVCAACGKPWVRVCEYKSSAKTVRWEKSCSCTTNKVRPALVLDPFAGAGTVGLVAARLQRRCIGIELNPHYIKLARTRIDRDIKAGPSLWDTIKE